VNDQNPPQDVTAELAVLACLLASPETAVDVWQVISPADFYRPTHRALADVFASMPTVDPSLAVAEIRRRQWVDVQPDALLQLLPTLIGRPTVPQHAAVYAAEILEHSRRRQLLELATRTAQQAYNPSGDVDTITLGMLTEAEGLLDARPRETEPPMTVDDFLLGEDVFDWVIPNFIERGDRIILTGGEGGGKSTWERQIVVCLAAGIHPVTFDRIPPQRAMLIDLENGRMHLRRTLRPLVDLARRQGDFEADRLRILHRPQGLDLADLTDVAWLTDKVLAANPDLLVIAPLYKLHTSALDKEEAARGITHVIDAIRTKAACAVIIEAHAGHGVVGARSWRPAGSSLFMRWPEFGFGLKPNQRDGSVAVKHWRGPRDERAWPAKLRRGGHANTWPWIEDAPDEDESRFSA
jgi:hypothetical protein